MNNTKEIINKIIYQIKENKWIHYFIIIAIGIILSIPLAQIQIRDTHDGSLHFLRIIGTMDSIEFGQIPPIINENYCMELGYAMNLFYSPLVTYIPLLLKLITPTYMIALKLFGGLCIILSGIMMYKFVYEVTGKRGIAIFASIFYLIAPYKLANVYRRYAIGEFASFIFIPLVFLGLYNLFNKDGNKHYYLTIGAAGLLLTHTVTTVYTAIFCIIYILFNIKKLKEKVIWKKCIINAIFILLLSMLFWFPLLEANMSAKYTIMDSDSMKTNSEFAAQNTINFSQFFKDKGEENGTTFLIGIPTIIFIVLTIYCVNKVNKKYKDLYSTFILLSFIAIFMSSNVFPWKIMPDFLCTLQYPWRMVSFFVFFISFICGINMFIIIRQLIKKDNTRLIVVSILTILMIIYTIPIMMNFKTKDNKMDEAYENYITNNRKISHKAINRDYMPLKALKLQNTYVKDREDKTYVLEGNADIIVENKEKLKDIIECESIDSNAILEFPYLYYPGYMVTIQKQNGEILNIKPVESKNGYVSIKTEEQLENVVINVEYKGTIITKISYIVSGISLIGFIIYVCIENKRGKKSNV